MTVSRQGKLAELPDTQSMTIAYFSMEVGLEAHMPTYAGGLGILAGDSLRSAADLGIPVVGISLLYHRGYFCQHLDASGNQTETPAEWEPQQYMKPLDVRASVTIEGRKVWFRAWQYSIKSPNGSDILVFYLDTDVPENAAQDRPITDYLYGGDQYYRLCQEIVLGLGGVAMLRALGYREVATYHMNEGHSALLAVALLEEEAARSGLDPTSDANVERVREQCVFTAHTPVPAGVDVFPIPLARRVLGDRPVNELATIRCLSQDTLNMTALALFFSRYINGVSMRHEEVSHDLYPSYPINSITNGVHAVSWVGQPMCELFDRYVPQWRYDNLYLRYAIRIPLNEIRGAHVKAKQDMLNEVRRRTGVDLNPSVMTIGFARRMTQYKRANLLFADADRLARISREVGPIQVIYGGKAHPRDEPGKALIRQVFASAKALAGTVKVVYLEEYDIEVARYLCAGVDLWLNTPQKPFEASGTSGMKAALNGVPSFSVLDGWWVEGHLEGITGWSIGEAGQESGEVPEAAHLYNKLEGTIVPMFYERPDAYSSIMRSAIAINGSYYNTQRMVFQYLEHAYMPSH